MTTPSNVPEENADAPTPEQAAGPADAPAPRPATPPVGPPQPAFGPPGPPWPPAGDPFVPVYRAPRAPWINPSRRGHVVAAVIVGALAFGGGGLVLGHALASHDGRHLVRHGVVKPEQGQGLDRHRVGPGQAPRYPGRPGQLPPNAPAPVPTPTGSPTR